MSEDKPILVIGAGNLGMAIITNLAALTRERSITVLLRPDTIAAGTAEKLATLRDLKVDLLAGDVVKNTEAELSALFAPFHTIIHAAGVAAGSISTDSLLKVTRAVITARTPRFFPWQFGFDFDAIGPNSPAPLGAEQFELRQLLRTKSVTEWVIISVGMFMDAFFKPAFGIIDLPADTVRGLGSWDMEVTLSAVEDVGLLTAKIVLAQPEFKNEILYAAGETTTYASVAEMMEKVHGMPLKRELWTAAMLQERLKRSPDDMFGKWCLLFAQGKGVAWDAETTINRKMGIKMIGTEDYARSL